MHLIRVTVKKKTYVLIASLLETARYRAADFKALYHQRWQIKEVYKRQNRGWKKTFNPCYKRAM